MLNQLLTIRNECLEYLRKGNAKAAMSAAAPIVFQESTTPVVQTPSVSAAEAFFVGLMNWTGTSSVEHAWDAMVAASGSEVAGLN